MRKSLIIVASALLFAVGAAGVDRLRYDSTVFAGADRLSDSAKREVAEYPPCIRGVREDRCIQLYERGVRRSYQRWLAARGLGGRELARVPAGGARSYRPCRGRGDDNCQQRSAARRVVRAPVRTASRAHPVRTATARADQASASRAGTNRAGVSRAPIRRAQIRRAGPARVAVAARAPVLGATVQRPANPARVAIRAPARIVAPRMAPARPRPTTDTTPGI